ncbi:MAG: hypothetical protein IT372_21565 [Polyangiaceae bacterium]|nr:hypothetical protein [Polyangiaceae bacterium]
MKILWLRRSLEDGAPARDRRGAVYVEFLAVFFPIFTMFLSLVQFSFLQTASVIMQQSAQKAVRVAAVVIHDNPALYGVAQGSVAGKRREMIEDAAKLPLAALGNPSSATVTLNNGYGRDEMINLRVDYTYLCRVPLGRFVVCGAGGTKALWATASFPNQGADFIY